MKTKKSYLKEEKNTAILTDVTTLITTVEPQSFYLYKKRKFSVIYRMYQNIIIGYPK